MGVDELPPGNGNDAPVLNRTSLLFATTTTGAPVTPNEIPPIQLHSPPLICRIGSLVKVSEESAGAGLKVGASSRMKWRNGVASSPGGGLIAPRSCRY